MSLTNSLSSSVEHGGILLRGYMYHVKNWIGICRITLLATFHWHRITLRGIYSDVTLPYLTLASEGGLARCGKSRTTLEVLGSIPTLAKSRLLVISAWWDAAKFLIAMAPLAISCTWNSSREPGPTPRKELPNLLKLLKLEKFPVQVSVPASTSMHDLLECININTAYKKPTSVHTPPTGTRTEVRWRGN